MRNFLIIHRISTYSECADSSILISIIYVDRWLAEHPNIVLSYHNVHRLIAASVLLAIKINEEIPISNGYYASIVGVSLRGIIYLLATN